MVKTKRPNHLVTVILVMTGIYCSLVVSCTNAPKTGNENEVCIPVPKDSSALGKIDHFIPLDQLEAFKKDFNSQQDSISRREPELYIPASEAFSKAALIDLLKDPKNVGIRIYYGVKKADKRNEFRLLLVGVDAQGRDLYITKGSAAAAKLGGDVKGGLEFGQCNPPCH
jgi:hypothetical protein